MYFTLHHMNDVRIVKQGCSPKVLTRGALYGAFSPRT